MGRLGYDRVVLLIRQTQCIARIIDNKIDARISKRIDISVFADRPVRLKYLGLQLDNIDIGKRR